MGGRGGQTPARWLAHLVPVGVAAKRLQDEVTAFVNGLLDERFGLGRRHWQLLRWVVDEHDEATVRSFVAEAALSTPLRKHGRRLTTCSRGDGSSVAHLPAGWCWR